MTSSFQTIRKGSFAQRVAQMSVAQVENWDDDADLDFAGGFPLNASSSTAPTALSSRQSVRSESNAGDEDWHVLLKPNDEKAKLDAISSAKLAGIPLPANVPTSALLGGSIKRLGKKKSRPKITADDWSDDLDFPPTAGTLKLKQHTPAPSTPQDITEDDFDDWGEGSLGIRFAGTRRDGRARSSSVSAMSPSMGSITAESEDDDLNGLVLPEKPLDFKALLKKRRETEFSTPDVSPLPSREAASQRQMEKSPAPTSAPIQDQTLPPPPKNEDDDDFFADIDIGGGVVLDSKKLTLNRNLKVQTAKATPPPPSRTGTTLTFTDKPAPAPVPAPVPAPAPQTLSRIPRPLTSKPSRLAPVYESGVPPPPRQDRPAPTTTSAQLLRAKRSAPALRTRNYDSGPKPPLPFLPAGISNSQSHHIKSKPSGGHLRRESDPERSKSPIPRSFSRVSSHAPDTPSRTLPRRDPVPASLTRAAKQPILKPARRRNFGDGNELEAFDDLPTSATKESKFVKQPIQKGPPRTLRHQQSNSRLPLPDRMATPLPPPTPRSPTKAESTPRYLRDTAASRIAREQRLAGTRSRADGPIAPATGTNWKAQVAARSPHNSPTAARKKKGTGQQPFLIKQMTAPVAKNEKGMAYNPILQRWEGNEAALAYFERQPATPATTANTPSPYSTIRSYHGHGHGHSHSYDTTCSHPLQQSFQPHMEPPAKPRAQQNPPSPPRAPALISNISAQRGVQVEKGMVFDPVRMKWLKLDPRASDPLSSNVEPEEEDPFAGLEDLKDENDKQYPAAGGSMTNAAAANMLQSGVGSSLPSGLGGGLGSDAGAAIVAEEFDLGPMFIKVNREEEGVWRRRVEGWVGEQRDLLGDGWRWGIRDLARSMRRGI